MAFILALFLIISLVAILGVVSLTYLSAKGARRIVGTVYLSSSSLPRSVKKSLRESRHYGRLIGRSLQHCPPGLLRDRLSLMVRPVEEWLARLTLLERGLEKSYSERNLPREMRQSTFEIERLRREVLTANKEEAVYLRELIESKKHHLVALQELHTFQSRAELKIRKIASDLGTTHAEMVLIIAKGDFNENRLSRLDENLRDHIASMRDIMSAMDDLGYSGSAAH